MKKETGTEIGAVIENHRESDKNQAIVEGQEQI